MRADLMEQRRRLEAERTERHAEKDSQASILNLITAQRDFAWRENDQLRKQLELKCGRQSF
jgi:hypothetical protein